jgi:L-threonylcarbamoyladenylate synthase
MIRTGLSFVHGLIEQGVALLRAGGLVAFPTETVYGLGADATNADAVRKIFAAKGRPSDNPLIVHVADAAVARRYVAAWPETAEKLAKAFWPGPLTLVLPKAPTIPDEVSAGLDSVGLRVPNHPVALELLRAFGGAVAGPSANRSNRISPTTAEHVRAELGGTVDLILDGGPCAVGIESTVLDVRGSVPTLLRPGGVSRSEIEAVVGPIRLRGGETDATARSPGQKPIHYAPRTPAFRVVDLEKAIVADNERIGVVRIGENRWKGHAAAVILLPAEPAAYAHRLYATLRDLDAMGLDRILIELPPADDEWLAVRDRIERATRPVG